MKFSLFFFLMLIVLVYGIVVLSSPFRFFLLWPAANMTLVMMAYILNKPFLIMGKKSDGTFNLKILKTNLPWIFFTWFAFQIRARFTSEEFCNNIKGTNLWLSRRPGPEDDLSEFDIVVDLTCEFPYDTFSQIYICCPNLNGHALSQFPVFKNLPEDKKILIHCANGHGRSSLFAAIILVERNFVTTVDEALKLIAASRPKAKPNSSQRKWLISLNQSNP